ncbi:Adaptor protein complex 2 (AP-2), alpha subunitA [Monocercomonoides exilis]|uniref:Adaptor protein complex 2 (AP-2), alpha subunitA n=1 Tax=Monocercomonoides exilis TaxID=2049356 RepID=UPI0035597852|nr:Adaptor protein complex 2 (AP-2), alpha subunitA [Monocercomonoides exilis]|eukprot:MONOS_988.1-p1 / transcript=MONOS_988.1 / gene=MONOS_988 / organism=Monocercomonoides_exilis_PA203 / gene_product= Adaptor protein complex 2 (AP-2), alpha subunit A / transcript_product= Adaptor protein complex 2 (AP-2), alpha subunit A / location=Mono_scaffold00016:181596-184907(+) / protein_length=1019 / sequence_SO=supercontig / SO=protein_coding / is_pseudo=false
MAEKFKGLSNFLNDIRFCKTRDLEEQRVEKELSHIREAFINPKKLDMYNRKKYALKLMYIDLLGFSVDFGHMETMELLHSPKYSDKVIGYVVLGSLVNEKSEIIRLVNQALLSDLTSRRECFQALALTFIANCGNTETAETLANNVGKLLMSKTASKFIIKKASLCLLHMFKKNPDIVQQESWNERLVTLLQNRDGGVLTCVMSLLNSFAAVNPEAHRQLLPVVCRMIKGVVLKNMVTGDYMYDNIPAPWLVVKVFQFIQHYPVIDEPEVLEDLIVVLRRIINTDRSHFVTSNPTTRVAKKHNAMLAVLFEAIYAATALRIDQQLIKRCISHMRFFLAINDPDILYLSLQALQSLCPLDPTSTGDDPMFVDLVEKLLMHRDIVIRRRALDVLFEICNEHNSADVVAKLISYLDQAEIEIKDELVLKIAILAEKYHSSMEWYVDVIFRLLQLAGDSTPPEIWYRIVQVISNNPQMQSYASAAGAVMLREANLPDSAVQMCAYVVGEYHKAIPPSSVAISEIVERIGVYIAFAKPATKAILVSALAKIGASTPEVSSAVTELLTKYTTFIAEDTQERSCEFLSLLKTSPDDAKTTLGQLPPFPERQSILLRDLKKKVKESGIVERASRHLKEVKDEKVDEEEQGNDDGIEESTANILNMSQMHPAMASSVASAVDGTQLSASAAPVEREADDLIDLSDFGAVISPVSSSAAASVSGSSSAIVAEEAVPSDPAKLLETLSTSPSPHSYSSSPLSVSSASVEQAEANPQLDGMFYSLLCSDEGKLYDDAHLCIMCQHQYQKHEGRVLLTWTNKSAVTGEASLAQPLMNVTGVIESSPELSVQAEAVGSVISPGSSVQQRIVITQTQPAFNSPLLMLSYTVGTATHRAAVKVPAVGLKFFCPLTPPKEMFVQQWQAVPDSSPMAVADSFLFKGAPLNPQTFQQVMSFLQTAAKMQPLPQYDDTPQTLCFAAGVCCAGAAQPMPLMFKVQMSPAYGMLMLTVKGCTAQIAEITRKYVMDVLKGM